MISYWTFILVAPNNTGKTTFQKFVVANLCGRILSRLNSNRTYQVSHPDASRDLRELFVMSRSFQEKRSQYGTIQDYFRQHFKDSDVCILSSHPDLDEIQEMIRQCHLRQYNVAAVFFKNASSASIRAISCLNWDERLWLYNPKSSKKKKQLSQLRSLADRFSVLVCKRSHSW